MGNEFCTVIIFTTDLDFQLRIVELLITLRRTQLWCEHKTVFSELQYSSTNIFYLQVCIYT